jgi:hypothetical protein
MGNLHSRWRRGKLLVLLTCALGYSMLYSSKQPLLKKMVNSNEVYNSSWHEFQPNRTIALVHIGKAGGLTLRAMTSLKCRLPRNQVTDDSIRQCIIKTFGTTNPRENPLALQTIFYAHMNSMPPSEMTAATSWLLALRNPVDRVISAYQYSHPAACQDEELLPNSTKGCTNFFLLQPTTKNKRRQDLRNELQLTKLFVTCFPQLDMTTLVQSALSSKDDKHNDCAGLARDFIVGKGYLFPAPHLSYNYRHYQSGVLDVNSESGKEWFGIRTEHLAEDFDNLNRQLGWKMTGDSNKRQSSIKLTHGSEKFRFPSKLSIECYQNLCCLLQDELFIYRDMVRRIMNLNDTEKFQTIYSLTQKCGMFRTEAVEGASVSTTISSTNWETLDGVWLGWTNSTCAPLMR